MDNKSGEFLDKDEEPGEGRSESEAVRLVRGCPILYLCSEMIRLACCMFDIPQPISITFGRN